MWSQEITLIEKCFTRTTVLLMITNITGRRGDCNGALSLWTSIQDSDVPPSSQFLSTLAALLRSHKLKVPFDVTSAEESPMQG